MRRLLILLVLALVAGACLAQPTDIDIVYSGMIPQIVIWDEVTTDSSGEPLLPGDTIEYEVFFDRAPFDEAEAVSLGVVTLPEATVDLSGLARGWYYVGVRSIGTDAGGTVEYSAIAWSNDQVAVGPTSRFAYFVTGSFIPASPQGLQTVGP